MQSELYLGHVVLYLYQSFSINYMMISNIVYYIDRTENKMKNITVPG